MTTPIGPTVVDLEDMGKAANEAEPPKPVDLTTVRLEGDNIPEELKGKSVAEMVDFSKRLSDALRISEMGRQTQPASTPAPIAAAPVEEKELDPEEVRQMFADDPVKAFELLQERWAKKADAHLTARLQPLISGAASGAESVARGKYPEEFALFEKDIKSIVDGMPSNQRSALSNPAAWDDLIGYVRGKSGNFEKFIQSRTDKALRDSRKGAAQASQELETGLNFTGTAPRSATSGTLQAPDATTQHICDTLGITYAEYVKWSKV